MYPVITSKSLPPDNGKRRRFWEQPESSAFWVVTWSVPALLLIVALGFLVRWVAQK